MIPALEFAKRINVRHWREHRLRTGLTALGISAGVALVIAVSVVNSTLMSSVTGTAERLAGDADLEVSSPDSSGLSQGVVRRVAGTEGVARTIPVLRVFSELTGPAGSRRTLLLGVTTAFPALYEQQDEEAVTTTGTIEGPRDVMLAAETARALGISGGDTFRAEVPGGVETFTMAGSFSGPAVDSFGGDMGVMALPAAQEVFERERKVDSVYVIAEEGSSVREVEDTVRASLGHVAVVGTPDARAQGFEEPLEGIAALTSLAGVVALFVAAFVVFNTMSMSVAERRREISLALAMGASRRHVIVGFVAEAGVLGAAASLVGLGAGFLLARAFVDPGLEGLLVFGITAEGGASLSLQDALLGLGGGLGIAMLGAYIPARRVFTVSPVESLRPQNVFSAGDVSSRGWIAPLRLVAGVVILAAGIAMGLTDFLEFGGAATRTNVALVLILGGIVLLLPVVVASVLRALRRVVPTRTAVSMRLAIESLLRNGGRTTITVGALVLTLGIVVAVGGALDSYESEWHRSATQWHAAPIQVMPTSYVLLSSDQGLPREFGRVLEDVEGVLAAYPFNVRVVNVEGRQTAIYVTNYTDQRGDPAVAASVGREFREGVAEILERGQVMISVLAAENKGLDMGDRFTIPTPTGPLEVVVGGISSDLNPLDSMYMSSEMFRRHWPDALVDRFEVSPVEGVDVSQVMERIDRVAKAEGVPIEVMTKEGLVEASFAPIAQLLSVARGIQLAALIIAALAIANTMFITILERRWEFGLQRALGMDGGSLAQTLLREAALIGLIGTLGAWIVGLGMGYLMVLNMESAYAFSFPFEPPMALMGITLLLGVVIAVAAGAYPSRAAFRTPIIEALRTE